MKSLKLFAILAATLSLSLQAAQAAPAVQVEELKFLGLSAYKGKNISVFYVSGREAVLGTRGQALKVKSVKKGPVQANISIDGMAVVPPILVPKTGFDAFNYIVVAVHKKGQAFYLTNPDGTPLDDPRLKPNSDGSAPPQPEAQDYQYEKIAFISLIKLAELRGTKGDPKVATMLVFDRDL